MKKVTDIVHQSGNVAGQDCLPIRVYDADHWLTSIMTEKDDAAFLARASDRMVLLGRLSVTTAVGLGQVFLAVKERLPGQFQDWLEANDISDRTARMYMSFARQGGPILESKSMQKVGFKQLAALLALPAEDFDKLAKGGKLEGMTVRELGALPPSEVRKLVSKIARLETDIDKGRVQVEELQDGNAALTARLREAEAGKVADHDPSDQAYSEFMGRIADRITGVYQDILMRPPANAHQLAELHSTAQWMAASIVNWPHGKPMLDRLPPEAKAAAERAMALSDDAGM